MGSLWLSLAVSAVAMALAAATTSEEWISFKRQYGRVYQPEEELLRRQVFADNLVRIQRHNVEFDAGRSLFRLGVNRFADLTNEEFRQKILSELKPAALSASASSTTNNSSDPIPDSFDWRTEGVPIIIRNQGQMGDSWTISVVSSVESGVFISSGQVVSLSRQNLADCLDWPSTALALEYVRDHGIASEADYPETGGYGDCQQVSPTAGLDEVHSVPEGDETALAEGLLQNPAPVLIDAGQFSFQLYSSGIYSDDKCSQANLDHALLLVGYGTSANTDFWTLANSWGSSWGEQGYVRIERGVNMCGVASAAAYPTGVHLL